jgi:exopolysaccharide production protein ExoZ
MNRNVQGLRAFAAYGVVAHHIIDSLNHYIGHFDIRVNCGAAGVDVFFVISGFIMAATTGKRETTPGEFAMHRIVRVVPIYWLMTLLCAGFLFAGFNLFGGETFSLQYILQSLFFISERPIVFVGWTLEYEMMFYGIFSLCLFINSRSFRLYTIVGSIIILWLVGLRAEKGSHLSHISNGIILEFAIGIVLWQVSRNYILSVRAAAIFVAFAIAGFILPDFLVSLPTKTLVVAPAAGMLVFAAISLEARGVSVGESILKRQGDASYSIYLLHPLILQVVGKAAILAKLTASPLGLCLTIAGMFVAVALAGTFFHLSVERPLTGWLRTRTHGISQPPVAAPSPRLGG